MVIDRDIFIEPSHLATIESSVASLPRAIGIVQSVIPLNIFDQDAFRIIEHFLNSKIIMNISKSQQLFSRAQESIPGGVNSPVRAFKSVGGTPIFLQKAKGAYLYDADGNQYIDYINSWGPMILGHAYEPVVKAIQEKAFDSTSFGAPTELEIEMAELIKSMVPNVDLIRMVSSGTEACMSAIRLARGYTGKNKIIKFEGCYHGHADFF